MCRRQAPGYVFNARALIDAHQPQAGRLPGESLDENVTFPGMLHQVGGHFGGGKRTAPRLDSPICSSSAIAMALRRASPAWLVPILQSA